MNRGPFASLSATKNIVYSFYFIPIEYTLPSLKFRIASEKINRSEDLNGPIFYLVPSDRI